MEEKKMLRDTPMEWRVTVTVKSESTKEEEKEALLQDVEALKDSILGIYPETKIGRSFEERLDGSLAASVCMEHERFGLYSYEYTDGRWERFSQILFSGTVEEIKRRLADMALNTKGKGSQRDTVGISCIKMDHFGRYCTTAKLRDRSIAEYKAELHGRDAKRLRVFKLEEILRDAGEKHPGLPVVLIHRNKVVQYYDISSEVTDFLDYRDPSFDKRPFTSREEFREYLGELFEGDQERVQKEFEKAEPYWTEAVLIRTL